MPPPPSPTGEPPAQEEPPKSSGPGCWPVLIPLSMLAVVFFFILGICAR